MRSLIAQGSVSISAFRNSTNLFSQRKTLSYHHIKHNKDHDYVRNVHQYKTEIIFGLYYKKGPETNTVEILFGSRWLQKYLHIYYMKDENVEKIIAKKSMTNLFI